MDATNADVLIVGAGPTGLTLACQLARQGVRLRIIDALPAPPPGSRGKGVQPRSLELFDDLGVADRVIAHGSFTVKMRMHDETGAPLPATSRERPPRPDAPYLSPLLTPQWRVEEALRAKLVELAGKDVEFGVALEDYTQDESGVTARLTGSDGSSQARFRWLVGCDGGKSHVRQSAGMAFLGETLEKVRMLLADVRLSGLDREHWQVWRSAEGFLALCPLPSTDQYQFQASLAPGQDEGLSRQALQRVIERRTANADIKLVDEPGWTSLWRANVRMVDRYRDGFVLLAGDSAHVHSPAGGQGMNTGIQDACNLGWKLAAVLGGADASLIDTYQAERLPIAAGVLGLSNQLMREAITAGTMVVGRREDTLQLGLGYRDGPLSVDSRPVESEGLRAGDRAPEAPGLIHRGQPARMFDLLRGPHVTLLGFGARWRPLLEACARDFGDAVRVYLVGDGAEGDMSVADVEAHALAAYGSDTLFVVRPDNYVGMVTTDDDFAPVAAYLRRITARGTAETL